jgi:HSP20 family protein
MTTGQELQVQEKKEVAKAEESTIPARYYVPQTDIFEDENSLTVVMEMPGVAKDALSVDIENDQLRVEGKIDFKNYETLEPVYTEYNVGHYKRAFSLSNKVDQEKITAILSEGLLTLTLPKAEDVKPRKIAISS